MENPQIDLDAVLAAVNEVRTSRGMEPLTEIPQADPGRAPGSRSGCCPMTVALDALLTVPGGNYGAIAYFDSIEGGVIVPKPIGDFIEAYDDGLLPQFGSVYPSQDRIRDRILGGGGARMIPSLDYVLQEVNLFRAERGLEPIEEMPQGQQSGAHACPLAHALEIYAVVPNPTPSKSYYRLIKGDMERPLNPVFNSFAMAFDRGVYPDLIIEAEY